MSWNPFCTNPTKAAKRYQQRVLLVMTGYMLAVYGTTSFVHNRHPAGALLYVLSLLPALPIFCLLGVVALYLREEVDEFKRQQMVIAMLCAIGVTLSVGVVAGFLQSYGAITALPPFTEFVVFWVVMGLVSAAQHLGNRVPAGE